MAVRSRWASSFLDPGFRWTHPLTAGSAHRRIPARFENAIHAVGFALLLILLIYVNVQDFINPIQLPGP
jgi:hypothetical protein